MGTGGSAGAGVARWFHPLRRVGMCRDGIAQGSALVVLKLGFLRGAGRGALPEGTYRIWGSGGL